MWRLAAISQIITQYKAVSHNARNCYPIIAHMRTVEPNDRRAVEQKMAC